MRFKLQDYLYSSTPLKNQSEVKKVFLTLLKSLSKGNIEYNEILDP